jgi:hypothetical protein
MDYAEMMRFLATAALALFSAAIALGQIDIVSRSATIAGTGTTQFREDSLYSVSVQSGLFENASASLDRDRLNGDSPLNCTVFAGVFPFTTASAGSAEITFKVPTQLAEAAVSINPRAALSATSGFTVTIDGATQTIGQYGLSGSTGFRDIEPFGAGTHEVKITFNRPGNPTPFTRLTVTVSMKDPTQPHTDRAIRWKSAVDGDWQEAKKWQDNLMPVRGDTAVFDVDGTFALSDQELRDREIKRVIVRGSVVQCRIRTFRIGSGLASNLSSLSIERGGAFIFGSSVLIQPQLNVGRVAVGTGAPDPAQAAELVVVGSGNTRVFSGPLDIGVTSPGLVECFSRLNASGNVAIGAGEAQGGTLDIRSDGTFTASSGTVAVGAAKRSRGQLKLGLDAKLETLNGPLHVGAPELSSGRVTLAEGSTVLTSTIQGGGVQTGGTGSAKGGKAVFDLTDGGELLATSIFLGNSRSPTTPRAKMTVGGQAGGEGAFVFASERLVVGRFSPATIDCLSPGSLRATNLEIFSNGRVTTAVGAAPTDLSTIFLTGTAAGTPALSLTGSAVLHVGKGTTVLTLGGAEGFVGGGLESGLASLVLEEPPSGDASLAIGRLTVGSTIDPAARGKIELRNGVLDCKSLFLRPNATLTGSGAIVLTSGTGVDEGEVLNAGTFVCDKGPGTIEIAGRFRSGNGSKLEIRFQQSDDPLANGLAMIGGNPLTENFALFGELVVRFTDFNPAPGQRYRLVTTAGFLDPNIADNFTLTLVGRRNRILTVPATLEIGNGSIDLVIN